MSERQSGEECVEYAYCGEHIDRIKELERQLAEAQARAERAEATVAALRGTLRAIESETADSYDLFEQRVLQRVREALAAPDPGADQDGTAQAPAADWDSGIATLDDTQYRCF